ncbi:MAG: DUF4395 domain-containing protein [Candidatus Dormibacteria bacterium]
MSLRLRALLRFPNPVNEVTARLVAFGVLLMSIGVLVGQRWLLVPLFFGLLARALTGPTLSPLGQLATRVITPRLPVAPRPVPGPPKRFAQAVGAIVTGTALVLAVVAHAGAAVTALAAVMVLFSGLESLAGFCVGCLVFAQLMRIGLVPASVCRDCADITRRAASPLNRAEA